MNTIQAVYETKRQNILIGFMNASDASNFDRSYVYAYEHRLCPYFHLDYLLDYDREDPFDSAYFISRETTEKVVNYCDTEWLAKRPVTFYGLEDKGFSRVTLMIVLRYAYLNNRFDADFYKFIDSDCPSEGHGITRPYTLDQVYI